MCIITTSQTGQVPYFTIILQYINTPDWRGALFYHYTTIYQHPWLDGCRILPLYCNISTSLTGRVPYFTIILHYNNIPDRTGALFYHNTAIYQHPWLDGCLILQLYYNISTSLTGRPPYYNISTSLTGRVHYFTIILHYNNIPDWTGAVFTIILQYNYITGSTAAVFYHNTVIYQHPTLDRCIILP